ncbi:General transcription and DNA repair factor IIH subunit tcf-29 [Penicillium chermesinum]|uniref:General transcription and DNA repair factor IIH subunit tcf-29 n=1 Tax=Penicillium chermesinum TaxID=63820 RepID=A0A9W9NC99_9EURO|nr:General transcription and DNA repair factor IIH subunit tcf-29 [Penicillium chermesinum]KAJ5217230.1 General transcription and DNA repair factor IIH subunit tcf-29 [Penicillium chermesinum]
MAPLSGAASLKKKDGTVTLSEDGKTLSWSPREAGGSAVKIPVSIITNLQQTPPSASKVMLKVLVQPPDAPPNTPPVNYVFTFTDKTNARGQADAIKDVLGPLLNSARNGTPSTPVPGGEGMSSAMAIASALTSAATAKKPWDDDNRLKEDTDLQQSLLKANPTLQKMFMDSLQIKPETLTSRQFMAQFWSTRLHLLRAHAIERAQSRGAYNVLSSLKPRVEDNVTRLNITQEQVQLIFAQHPLVKRVYDENVPKLNEHQFWSRFFQSRLFKKLRGERISEMDATDPVLDKYLREDPKGPETENTHVPNFLDLAGNEDNNSQRRGNRPDLDMRPSGVDRMPIIRTLNSLSGKIMANVAAADGDPHAPAGMNEDTYSQLRLRDLAGDEEQNRITLNIRDQSRFFAQAQEDQENRTFAQQDPDKILKALRLEISRELPADGNAQLQRLVDPGDDDDEEMEDAPTSQRPVGSSAAMRDALGQILSAVGDRRSQMSETSSSSETYGLSREVFDRVTLTNATSIEFLHQFWQAFLSGDSERAGEVKSLSESLQRALDRIQALGDTAEEERQKVVTQQREYVLEVRKRTGRKLNTNFDSIPGGMKAVQQLLGPTISALKKASSQYATALAEETREAAAAAV